MNVTFYCFGQYLTILQNTPKSQQSVNGDYQMQELQMQKKVDKSCQERARENKNKIIGYLQKRFTGFSGKILDVGCNDGTFTLEIQNAVGASRDNVYGIEIDDNLVEKAKQKGIKVKKSDLNKPIDFESNYFDLIVANQVIEHLYLTDDFIKEIRRILKKGGCLVLSTVNLAAIHYRLMLLFGQLPICLHPSAIAFGNFLEGSVNTKYRHCSVFTHKGLVSFINYYGFKIECEYTHSISLIPPKIADVITKIFKNIGTFSVIYALKEF